MTTISTRKDLTNWLVEHMDAYTDLADIDGVANVIQSDGDRPNWDEDWTDYLGDLDLEDLRDHVRRVRV